MNDVKAGLIGLYQHPIIYKKGPIGDLRGVYEGSIRQYAQLGSQNAISGSPISLAPKGPTGASGPSMPSGPTGAKIVDINIPSAPAPAPEGPTGPQGKKVEFFAPEPKVKPPFKLPEEEKDLEKYSQYLRNRYSGPVGLLESDKMRKDTMLFNEMIKQYYKMTGEYNRWIASGDHTFWQFAEWMDKIGFTLIGELRNFAIAQKIPSDLTGELLKHIENAIKGITKLSGISVSNRGAEIKNILHDMFVGKPAWSTKFNHYLKKDIDKLVDKMGGDLGETIIPPGKKAPGKAELLF
jgi:hypothetical protein